MSAVASCKVLSQQFYPLSSWRGFLSLSRQAKVTSIEYQRHRTVGRILQIAVCYGMTQRPDIPARSRLLGKTPSDASTIALQVPLASAKKQSIDSRLVKRLRKYKPLPEE